MPNNDNSKRIVKNTLALYTRTLITIIVSLYTSRIVLEMLGVQDFGIYNIVGGVVVLFSFITAAMTSATQRFMNFELGLGSNGNFGRIFSVSMTSHICIAGLILLLGETVGLWLVNTQLNIPQGRMEAVHMVYQFSLLSSCVGILRVPYDATIVSHERMSFYAYMSILESILKLAVVYFLVASSTDKLVLYAGLTLCVSVVVLAVYKFYCNFRFEGSRYRFLWDVPLLRQLLSFSGWSMLGGASNVASTQGVNILLNIFCGVVVNAAMGIASQVMVSINSFVSSFQMAFNPHLVKSYAGGQGELFLRLINQTSRFSFYLAFGVVFPFIVCAEPLLEFWLGDVPVYSVVFTRLLLVFVLIDALSGPLWVAGSATGRIRLFMLVTSGVRFLNIPLVYLVLSLGGEPSVAVLIKVLLNFVTHLSRVLLLRGMVGLDVWGYVRGVMFRCLWVMVLVVPFPVWVYGVVGGWWGVLMTFMSSVLLLGVVVYFVGISRSERLLVAGYLRGLLRR